MMKNKKFNVLSGIFVVMWGILIIATTAKGEITETKLRMSDDVYGRFGLSVSISGDYAVVGAIGGAGSASIFKRDGTTWNQQATLKASDGWSNEFGRSVSISGDYAVVGAPNDDSNGVASGSAYIFRRDGTTWSQQAKLTASDGKAGDWFGRSVSISGDYAVVGTPYDDDFDESYVATQSGTAFIFKRDGTTWSQQAKLRATDEKFGDLFGWSVSISGDYAVVGAHRNDDHGEISGTTYIFKRDGSTWTQQAELTVSSSESYYFFGFSVSISGDYAVVGAIGGAGTTYIFKRDGSTWTQQAKLKASDAPNIEQFGWSVSISGDYVLVGAPFDNDNEDFGSAFIFKRDGTIWSQQAKLTASDGKAGDLFGCSVSISGDYVVIGAESGDDKYIDSGSAYIFDLSAPSNIATPGRPWIPLLLLDE